MLRKFQQNVTVFNRYGKHLHSRDSVPENLSPLKSIGRTLVCASSSQIEVNVTILQFQGYAYTHICREQIREIESMFVNNEMKLISCFMK